MRASEMLREKRICKTIGEHKLSLLDILRELIANDVAGQDGGLQMFAFKERNKYDASRWRN